jgi:hypothetical protein
MYHHAKERFTMQPPHEHRHGRRQNYDQYQGSQSPQMSQAKKGLSGWTIAFIVGGVFAAVSFVGVIAVVLLVYATQSNGGRSSGSSHGSGGSGLTTQAEDERPSKVSPVVTPTATVRRTPTAKKCASGTETCGDECCQTDKNEFCCGSAELGRMCCKAPPIE